MFSILKIKSILNAPALLQDESAQISELLSDSRKLSVPKNALFFAISGNRLDGHYYIDDLYIKGVRNFVIETALEKVYEDANIIQVSNAVQAMQKIVQTHREKFDYPVIGITGSNGKTIIKEWFHQLLQTDYNIVRSPKSYNSQIGVPLSVWSMTEQNNLGIFEAGISEPDEMQKLQKIIQPSIGIFTNIGSAHGQNFISDTHKVKEKLKLFLRSKVLIYCKDHTLINQSISDFWQHTINDDQEKPRFFSWSENVAADLRIVKKQIGFQQCILDCKYENKALKFELPFTDSSSIENAINCIMLLLYLGFDNEAINQKLKKLKRIEMRLEQKKGVNNCMLINDSYNSDLESLKIALDFLAQQEKSETRTVILSEILQSGIPAKQLYWSVSELLERANVSTFIGVGAALFKHKSVFEQNEKLLKTRFYKSTEDFLNSENLDNFNNESILLKGARNFQFEKIDAFLEEKAHTTVFEINLNAIVHNLKFFTSKLKQETKVMAMVKAFAYGAGIYEVAKLLEFHRVDYLGVAYADEGITLRKAGIKLPIMVLNPEKRSFNAMIRYQLEPEIYSFDLLKNFTEALNFAEEEKPFPIHINFDTGMRRLGFEAEDLERLGMELSLNHKIKVASIYTHLAATDHAEWDDFTRQQIALFEKLSEKLIKNLAYRPDKHVLNSNGIVRFSEAQYDMVRLGLGLYGLNDFYPEELEAVGSLKTKISQIRKLQKGETVGYGRVGKMEKDGKIGVLAIGYADGLSRKLSNGVGNVFVNGKRIPIIGNVCMDMTMIDLTTLDDVKVGDVVEIFGKNISVNELAKQAETISYEVLTSIGQRVKRVFFME